MSQWWMTSANRAILTLHFSAPVKYVIIHSTIQPLTALLWKLFLVTLFSGILYPTTGNYRINLSILSLRNA